MKMLMRPDDQELLEYGKVIVEKLGLKESEYIMEVSAVPKNQIPIGCEIIKGVVLEVNAQRVAELVEKVKNLGDLEYLVGIREFDDNILYERRLIVKKE